MNCTQTQTSYNLIPGRESVVLRTEQPRTVFTLSLTLTRPTRRRRAGRIANFLSHNKSLALQQKARYAPKASADLRATCYVAMSAPAASPTRPRSRLPAGLIFTTRALRQYRRWQSLQITLTPTECGFIPTATEYDGFQQWLKKQDSGYFSDVFEDISAHIKLSTPPANPNFATICQHTIHPVALGTTRARCPVCTIDMHLNYMKVLTHALRSANGRPLPCTGTPSDQQENLYIAWSQGKMSTLQEVCELESWSEKEATWSEKHPHFKDEEIQSATKALELYWFEVAGCEIAKQCCKKKKAIVFAEDTNFAPGRPTDYFLRRSPRYEPGKYTIPDDEREDDGTISEDSDKYSHARVFAVGGSVNAYEDDTSLAQEFPLSCDGDAEELEEDDEDSDWEDIDFDEVDEESNEGSYISFEEKQEPSFVVFSYD